MDENKVTRFAECIRENLLPHEQCAYIFRRILGWKYKKIADFLGIRVGAVSKAIHQARVKLIQAGLQDEEVLDN